MKKITSILLSVAMLLAMAVMFTGCGGPSEDAIYPKSVEVEGTNGHGLINEHLNTKAVYNKRNMAEKAGNEDLYQHYDGLANIYNSCQMTVVDGKNGSLSNGDIVTLKITSTQYNEKDLEELGFTEEEITFNEFKYEVKDLKEPIKVDLKKNDIILSYSGFNGEGEISVSDNLKLKDSKGQNWTNVIYYECSKTSELSNGDKITITPHISEENTNFVLKNKDAKYEFTVSGLPEFPDTLDGIDTSEVDKLMDDYVNNSKLNVTDVGDFIFSGLMSENDNANYKYDLIPITDIKTGKLDDKTTKYYKYKHDNRAIYCKTLTISYTAVADKDQLTAKKGDVVKGSERVIVYANVVVVDGKLHLINPNYNSSDSSVKAYLDNYYDENGSIIPYSGDYNIIDVIREKHYNTIEQDYNEFIQKSDVGEYQAY